MSQRRKPTNSKVRRESTSFEEPSTPEDQTNYNLTLESNRKSRSTIRKEQPQVKLGAKEKNQRQEIIRGRIITERTDSSSPETSRERNVRTVKTKALKPSNLQQSRQKESSSGETVLFRTPSPTGRKPPILKRGPRATNQQNLENISPQPGTSRDVRRPINRSPQRGVPQQAATNPAPNRRKSKFPIKTQDPCLREIYKLQLSTNLLIPKLPFSRMIRELLHEHSISTTRITPTALTCLQESSEMYLVNLFADSYRCTLHRERVTLAVKDLQLVRYIRSNVS